MQRVLVIGLDGASPSLIEKWQEYLPNLKLLINKGAFGRLTSVVPPRSIPAWYCFATGMNPAKLGVYGFSQRRPGTYDYTFANFTHCQARPFWEWTDQPAGIVHLPGTYPPRPVNGFLISGWPAPLNAGNLEYTYPRQLSREIDTFLGQPHEFISPLSIEAGNEAVMLAERLRILKMHADVGVQLLSSQTWQVAVVVLTPMDRASHQFWRHMDPGHPHHDPAGAEKWGQALRQVYQASDAEVGRLLDLVDDHDWVFVISDHGFGPVDRTFYLNEWLRREGYLVLKDTAQPGAVNRRTQLMGRLSAPLFKLNQQSPFFRKLAAPFKKKTVSNFLRNQYVQANAEGVVRLNHLPVDWERTSAYCPDESSLYLNLKGRDPAGMVAPGAAAENLLAEISGKLSSLRDPETGQPIPIDLYRKEDIYTGPYLADAPELTVVMDNFQVNVMAELAGGVLIDRQPKWSGNHTPEGLFLFAGPGVTASSSFNAQLLDIAPTVLHLMGSPVPQEMDGRVLTDVFHPGSAVHTRPVEYAGAYHRTGSEQDYSTAEQEQIEKQLRDLGYLG